MQRGLDHAVHLVRDLDAAGEIYDLLGFTVSPRNHHPWGTHNRIIQTPGFFLELLEVADPDQIPPHSGSFFSFGGYNKDFLARNGQGLSMLVLEGSLPEAEKAAFDLAGYGEYDLFPFARKARRPDGNELDVGFTLAYAIEPASPDLAVFACTQTHPENFWSPSMQRHANNVTGVAGVVLVADVPADHVRFIETVTDVSPLRATDDWYVTTTPRGQIDIMTRAIFSERFGVAAPVGAGLRFAAVRFHTTGAPGLRRGLEARRMIVEQIEGLVVVPPTAAMGATLVFELPDAVA